MERRKDYIELAEINEQLKQTQITLAVAVTEMKNLTTALSTHVEVDNGRDKRLTEVEKSVAGLNGRLLSYSSIGGVIGFVLGKINFKLW